MTPTRRFNWTDKAALATGLMLLALTGTLWLFAVVTVGSVGAQHLVQKSGGSALAFAALAVGLLWVALQGVHFTVKGIWTLARRHRGRARLVEGSLIDGRPFRGTVSTTALPFEATPALAHMMARPDVRTRSTTDDLRARA